MIVRVAKKFKFDGAHFLPHYDGICKNMHGHTWWVEMEVLGEVKTEGPQQGMVLDFSDFKTFMRPYIQLFDHDELNKTLKNPTAENIALFIYNQLDAVLESQYDSGESELELMSITVWESSESYARVLREDNSRIRLPLSSDLMKAIEEEDAP